MVGIAASAAAHPSDVATGPVTITTLEVGKDRSELQRLAEEGYAIAGVDHQAGTVDVITPQGAETASLRMKGFKVRARRDVDPTLAPDSNYKTPAEIQTILQGYAAQFPAIAHLESVGRSGEGRDIWAIKISDNVEEHETDEPTILFNGMHHAREVMTPEVAIDTIDWLLTRYGTDPQVTRWVDTTEIWVLPMLNVDGNNKVWTGSSMWRKNTRGGYGVDINRNYPYAWGSCNGSSNFTFADDYRGPSAASESETNVLMSLVARVQPVFDISYHSYSEIVIYPYGCDGVRTPTRDVIEPIGRELAGKIVRDNGRGTYDPGTSWELLYAVDGGDIDWMYSAHNVIPFVIEMNSSSAGFQPSYSLRQSTVDKLRPAWTYLMEKLSGSGVRGLVTDGAGRAQPNAVLTVSSLSSQSLTAPQTVHVKADGTYHLVLNPGMYHLSFDMGERHVEHDVTIGAQRVDLDVEL
jgi:hypothetical protein